MKYPSLVTKLARYHRYIWILGFILWIVYNTGATWHPWLELFTVVPATAYVLILLGLVLIIRWRRKRWQWLGLAITLLFCLNIFQMYIEGDLVSPTKTEARSQDMKVCIWNTGYFYATPVTREQALGEWAQADCDVYMMHEVWKFSAGDSTVDRLVKSHFKGYAYIRRGEFLTVVKGTINSFEFPVSEGYLQTTITLRNQTFDLYNMHIWYPLSPRKCEYFSGTLLDTCDVIPAFTLRQMQYNELVASLQGSQHPVIMGGDFNSLSNHTIIKDMKKRFRDIRSTRWWTNATFPSSIPLLRIDYLFVSESLFDKVNSYNQYCYPEYSDHCWQETVVKL